MQDTASYQHNNFKDLAADISHTLKAVAPLFQSGSVEDLAKNLDAVQRLRELLQQAEDMGSKVPVPSANRHITSTGP